MPTARRTKEPKKYAQPRSAAAAADRCYGLREERLELTRQADAIKGEEGFLREWIIEKLPASDATGIAGKTVRVTVSRVTVPVVQDWHQLYKHVVDTYLDHVKRKTGQEDGAFSLLNKALNAAAAKEYWDAGKAVPGVGKFQNKVLSFNKVA